MNPDSILSIDWVCSSFFKEATGREYLLSARAVTELKVMIKNNNMVTTFLAFPLIIITTSFYSSLSLKIAAADLVPPLSTTWQLSLRPLKYDTKISVVIHKTSFGII